MALGGKPQRKTPRLGMGEYVAPMPSNTAVCMARSYLMETVRRVYKPMLEQLSATVFPAYVKLARSDFDFDRILWDPRLSPHTQIPQDRIAGCHLQSALQKWARKFHCERDWFLSDTLRTLRGWYVAPDWRRSLRWNPIGSASDTLGMGEEFRFHAQGWEMQLVSWSGYRQYLRKEFEQKLMKYEQACRSLAASRGLVPIPHKYSAVNFDWFVLYQFAGLSCVKIARRDTSEKSVDESVVLRGVKAVGKLMAWGQLRTART